MHTHNSDSSKLAGMSSRKLHGAKSAPDDATSGFVPLSLTELALVRPALSRAADYVADMHDHVTRSRNALMAMVLRTNERLHELGCLKRPEDATDDALDGVTLTGDEARLREPLEESPMAPEGSEALTLALHWRRAKRQLLRCQNLDVADVLAASILESQRCGPVDTIVAGYAAANPRVGAGSVIDVASAHVLMCLSHNPAWHPSWDSVSDSIRSSCCRAAERERQQLLGAEVAAPQLPSWLVKLDAVSLGVSAINGVARSIVEIVFAVLHANDLLLDRSGDAPMVKSVFDPSSARSSADETPHHGLLINTARLRQLARLRLLPPALSAAAAGICPGMDGDVLLQPPLPGGFWDAVGGRHAIVNTQRAALLLGRPLPPSLPAGDGTVPSRESAVGDLARAIQEAGKDDQSFLLHGVVADEPAREAAARAAAGIACPSATDAWQRHPQTLVETGCAGASKEAASTAWDVSALPSGLIAAATAETGEKFGAATGPVATDNGAASVEAGRPLSWSLTAAISMTPCASHKRGRADDAATGQGESASSSSSSPSSSHASEAEAKRVRPSRGSSDSRAVGETAIDGVDDSATGSVPVSPELKRGTRRNARCD